MRMGIGLGVGINRSNYAQGIFNAYSARVVADGGVTEGGTCVDAVSSLLQSASLLLVPSGYKGGKLYAEIPTNGNGDLTWTRASDAFRTNASGLIQRVPWNLVQNSNDLTQSNWAKSNITITLNSIANPLNDLVNGQTFTPNTTNGDHYIYGSGSTITGQSYVISFFVKENGYTNCRVGNAATGGGVWFNLSNGTIISGTGGTITALSNGWYLASYLLTATGTSVNPLIGFAPSTSLTFAGNGTSGGYVFGAQLVEGTTAQTYLPTTDRLNFPRLSYMYGSCPSVLLEPQRTNLTLYSEQFDNAWWSKANAGVASAPVVTANAEISPDGTQNADRIVFTLNGGTASGDISQLESTAFVSVSLTRTQSVYIKTTDNTTKVFTFVTPTGAVQAITVTGTYQRFTLTATGVAAGSVRLRLRGSSSGEGTATSATIAIWGMQYEDGAYPTTYIPTTSATATRVADTASKTGISSLIGQSEGTIFVDFYVSGIGANNINIYNNDRTPSTISTNAIMFKPNGSIECQTFLGNGTFTTLSITASTYTVGQRIKLAYRYKSGDFALYINGIQKGTSTSTLTFVGTKSQIYLDDNAVIYGYQEAVHYNQFGLFTNALTNAELTQLTT